MKRGPIVIVIILVVALAAAALSVWYHYHNQQRAQAFWGTTTAVLIGEAPRLKLLELGESDRDIPLGDGSLEEPEPPQSDPDAPPSAQAVVFNQIPWIVVGSKDAAGAKGISNLRRALVLDATFDWSGQAVAEEPRWRYGVSMNDGRNWATVLFDFDSRQVGLTGGHKTALLDPDANKDFRDFFAEQFPPEAKESRQDRPDEPGNREPSNRQDEQK